MTEQKCLPNELLDVPPGECTSPTCEEGGGEKGEGAAAATRDAETASGDAPADFFATEKNPHAADELGKLLASLSPAGIVRIGRPPKLTPELKARACLLLCMGLSRLQAATWLDLDHATIGHAAERDPDFARALARAEEFQKMGPVVALAAAGLKNWRAAAWLLSHQKHPTRLTAEERAQRHQVKLEVARRKAELTQLNDLLTEERIAVRNQRDEARKRKKEAEQAAKYEAENPHLFRRKKKKGQQGVAAGKQTRSTDEG